MDDVVDAIPNLSVITRIELLCWNTDAQTEQRVQNFIADSVILNISEKVIRYCVIIRKGKKVKTPDAIIAATALANNFTLITRNIKDFEKVDQLKLSNPYEMM